MDIIKNLPFFSIMLCMLAALCTFLLGRKGASRCAKGALFVILVMSAVLTVSLHISGESFVFWMGHFPAPWGNEIRAGQLEAVMAAFTATVALVSLIAGDKAIKRDVDESKQNLYYLITLLMEASLLALIYTNDLFTGYVFIEINTIAGCGLIMIKNSGRAIASSIRYMVVSLVGSGLFLIGVTLLYSITGHLLMSNIKDSVSQLSADGSYDITITIITALMTVGLSIKSGLFPFHLWIPDGYTAGTSPSSAMLSGMVSKGYIFLLIKVIYRVIGTDVFAQTGVFDLIFAAGIVAMIMGSVGAIRAGRLRRMTAYSSVSQIGYIFMGIGLGSPAGCAAGIFHIITHGITKSLLFLCADSFTKGKTDIPVSALKGQGKNHKAAAIAFTAAALSIIGFPLMAGFIAKMLLADASFGGGWRMYVALCAIAVSTLLNVVYFFRCIINLWALDEKGFGEEDNAQSQERDTVSYNISVMVLAVLNIAIGVAPYLLSDIITKGLNVFD